MTTAFAVAAGVSSFVALERSAIAEESAYCEKARARAASDASLLFAPTVQAQGIKFPNNGTIDSGVTTGAGYQFRASLSISPLDMYKGVRVTRVGEADCERHEVVASARDILAQATDAGRLPALEKQVEFIDSKKTEWEAIAAKTDERVEAHVTSLRDAAEVRARIAAVLRAREQHRGDAERLKLRSVEAFRGSLGQLVAKAEKETMEYERAVSHVRTLDAWDFRVTGGVIPQDKPVDFFGMVVIGFNFGAFHRNSAESRYLDARSRELAQARYELRTQLYQFRTQVKSARAQAKRELEIVDKQAALLAADKATIEKSDISNSAQALSLLSLDSILIESERVYLNTLIAELSRLENDDNVH